MVARLILLLALSFSVQAAEDGPSAELQADWASRLERAAELQAEGKARQAEAERLHAEKDAACFKKFLVNSCRAEARSEFIAASRAGKNIENEGMALERLVKKEQRADSDRRHSEAAPQREAELKQREAETTAERQAIAAEEAATRADKAKKAEEGARRKAAEAERQRQKQEEHAAKVAAQKEKAARKAAETSERMP